MDIGAHGTDVVDGYPNATRTLTDDRALLQCVIDAL